MQKIRVKSGVWIAEINQPFMQFCKALDDACWPLKVTPVITSAADGEHMDGSLHGAGYAWDVRTRNLIVPRNVAIGIKQILVRLGKLSLRDELGIVTQPQTVFAEGHFKSGLAGCFDNGVFLDKF